MTNPIQRASLAAGLALLTGAAALQAEEMREVAPGTTKGAGRKAIESSDKIRAPFLDRVGSFDLRSGRGVPSAAPDPGPIPSGGSELSPAQRKKALELMDRRRNWLLENAATIRRLEAGGPSTDRAPGTEEDPVNPGMTRSLSRLLQATDRGTDSGMSDEDREEDAVGAVGSRRSGGLQGDDPRGDRNRPEGVRDIGVRLIPEDGLAEKDRNERTGFRLGEASTSGDFGAPGQRPGDELFPDQRRSRDRAENPIMAEAASRRSGAFDQLLQVRSEGATGSDSAAGLFSRGAEARTSAFQSLLQTRDWTTAGPGPAGPGPNIFGAPPGTVGAAPGRPLDIPTAGLQPTPAFTPAAPAIRPAAPRIEPRPLALPVPTRSAF